MDLSLGQNEDAEFELSSDSSLDLSLSSESTPLSFTSSEVSSPEMQLDQPDSVDFSLTSNNPVDLSLSDTPSSLSFTSDDTIVAVYGVTSVNGMDGDVILDIPSKTSELINDSGFITNTVDDLVNYPKTSDLSDVAFTGEFSDLLHIPHGKFIIKRNNYIIGSFTDNLSTDTTIDINVPTKTSDLTNDSGFITKDVDDLTYYTKTSDLPSVNNGTLTIQKNGSQVAQFSANQSGNTTANIEVPTKISDLENDTGYVDDPNYVHTDNNFTTSLKDKLEGLADIQTIGNNLTLTNGRLDASGSGSEQVFRGETEPTAENILIWIDTNVAPVVRNAMLTADDKYFITSDDLDFVPKEEASYTALLTSDNEYFITSDDMEFVVQDEALTSVLMTADDKNFIDANDNQFITKGA